MTKPFRSFIHLLIVLPALLLLSLPDQVWAAKITTSVDRNPVTLDESFQITFTASDAPDGEPDFAPLERDFSITNRNNSSNTSLIDGEFSRTITWRLNVMAKKTGNLTIPAIQFGAENSQALSVQVVEEANRQSDQEPEALFLETSATPENPYLQSQVIYTLRLYTRVNIARAMLGEPELADAVIEKIGEDSAFNTQINGLNYSVTERKYAIFPQKSGTLTIKPLILTADIIVSDNTPNSRFYGFFNPQTQTKRVESKSVTLQVKPAPAASKGQAWLPAEHITLEQQWSGDLTSVKVGEPLTRTLIIQAQGTTLGQLPELGLLSTNGQLKSYPDQPVLNEEKTLTGVNAYREEKIALIPAQPGRFTLPAVSVPWFNTHSNKMELAQVPETTITVIAAEETAPAPSASPKVLEKPPAAMAQTPAKPQTAGPLPQPETPVFWVWASAFLAAGWLATLILFWTQRDTINKPSHNRQKPEDLRLNDCVKRLKAACAEDNANAAKEALLEWGRQKAISPNNLATIAATCDARLRDEILLLSQALYGRQGGAWSGKRLFQAFSEHTARTKLVVGEEDGLQPLYRL